jgi:hypothetical protein
MSAFIRRMQYPGRQDKAIPHGPSSRGTPAAMERVRQYHSVQIGRSDAESSRVAHFLLAALLLLTVAAMMWALVQLARA